MFKGIRFSIQALYNKGIPFNVIIPCEKYENTFEEETDIKKYQLLLSKAERVYKLPFTDPTEEAFWAAGKEVVNNSELLLAIWNGKPALGLGGTGDVVNYAHEKNKIVLHCNPMTQQIITLS